MKNKNLGESFVENAEVLRMKSENLGESFVENAEVLRMKSENLGKSFVENVEVLQMKSDISGKSSVEEKMEYIRLWRRILRPVLIGCILVKLMGSAHFRHKKFRD